jgi:hypothetical protein
LQPIFGYAVDRKPAFPWAVLGIGLTAAGVLLAAAALSVMAAPPKAFFFVLTAAGVLFFAVGNAVFHAAGGRAALANGKMSWAGIFVSSGALGVAGGAVLARVAGQSFPFAAAPLPPLIAACSLFLLRSKKPPDVAGGFKRVVAEPDEGKPAARPFDAANRRLPFAFVLTAILLSVVVRAYAGGGVRLSLGIIPALLIAGAAAALGKAAGGFFADKFGARATGTAALAVSLPFVYFSGAHPVFAVLAILFINATMPVTLGACASLLRGYPGLAFGLTAFALVIGSLFIWFLPLSDSAAAFVGVSLTAVSAVLTFLFTKNKSSPLQTAGYHIG